MLKERNKWTELRKEGIDGLLLPEPEEAEQRSCYSNWTLKTKWDVTWKHEKGIPESEVRGVSKHVVDGKESSLRPDCTVGWWKEWQEVTLSNKLRPSCWRAFNSQLGLDCSWWGDETFFSRRVKQMSRAFLDDVAKNVEDRLMSWKRLEVGGQLGSCR